MTERTGIGAPDGPAKRLRRVVTAEMRGALAAARDLAPFTFDRLPAPLSIAMLDALIGLGLIEPYGKDFELRYRVTPVGHHCLRTWEWIEKQDVHTEASTDWPRMQMYETDEVFDLRLLRLLKGKCYHGIPQVMDAMDYLGADRIRAALYRLDEKGLAQWDITNSIYLTASGIKYLMKMDSK